LFFPFSFGPFLGFWTAFEAAARMGCLVLASGGLSSTARLNLMRIMSDFREAMWGVVQQALSTLDVDYVEYATIHFDRLAATMADDRFEGWLRTVAGST
jgi:hypothetical protein